MDASNIANIDSVSLAGQHIQHLGIFRCLLVHTDWLLACAYRQGLLAFICEPVADAIVQKVGTVAQDEDEDDWPHMGLE